jgi:hypothetical protein
VDLIYQGMLRYGRPAPKYGRSDQAGVVVELQARAADLEFLKLVLEQERRTNTTLPVDALLALSCLREALPGTTEKSGEFSLLLGGWPPVPECPLRPECRLDKDQAFFYSLRVEEKLLERLFQLISWLTGEKRKMPEPEMLVVHFLVPKFDRNGEPYLRSVQKSLRYDLEERFDGWSSLGDQPLPGALRNPASEEVEYDDSWRYEVGISPDRLAELDGYLAELAHRLGQKAIWRVIYSGGEGAAITARSPEGNDI